MSFRWTNGRGVRSTTAMNFEFTTVPRILFGPGRMKEIRAIAPELGKRALVVCGSSVRAVERVQPLFSALTNAGLAYTAFATQGEPTIDEVRVGTKQARAEQCDLVIGFGGGSALDTGKAIAALLANEGDPLDYIEIIGKGKPLAKPSVPYIAIPTTAGTGSEVTRNAVLGFARTSRESQPAKSVHAAARGAGRSRTHLQFARGHHGGHGTGRVDAVDRGVCVGEGESDDGRNLPGRNASGGAIAAARVRAGGQPGVAGELAGHRDRSRGHVRGGDAERRGAGQRGAGRGARIVGAVGGDIRRAARRVVRGGVAVCGGGQRASGETAAGGKPRGCTVRTNPARAGRPRRTCPSIEEFRRCGPTA